MRKKRKKKRSKLLLGFIGIVLFGFIWYQSGNLTVVNYSFSKVVAVIFVIMVVLVLFGRFRGAFKKKKSINYKIEQIDKLTGEDFEQFLYHRLKKEGYKVALTSLSHDYGADLIIQKNYKCRKHIVIQAKRWKQRVGIQAVQEAAGSVAYYNASKAMVITNSSYTKSAKELAKANNITLIGRQSLIWWLDGRSFKEIGKQAESDLRQKEGICPLCGGALVLRNGEYNRFYGCSHFPKCRYTKNIMENTSRIS